MSEHIYQGVEAEFVDSSLKQIVKARLSYTQDARGFLLGHAAALHELLDSRHQLGAQQQIERTPR